MAYKFLHLKDGKIRSHYGDHKWKVGKKYTVEGDLRLCGNGFHASAEPLDALRYVQGDVLAVVKVSGDSLDDVDKSCHRSMKIKRAYRWTKADSVALAV